MEILIIFGYAKLIFPGSQYTSAALAQMISRNSPKPKNIPIDI
jgi:hypothetical protein